MTWVGEHKVNREDAAASSQVPPCPKAAAKALAPHGATWAICAIAGNAVPVKPSMYVLVFTEG